MLIVFTSCGQSKIAFIEGTWKVENKEQYEVWNKIDSKTYEGYGYKLKDGQKKRTEVLSISEIQGNLTYEATVPSQNEGATIPFVHNESVTDAISFENLTHDFPKKIIYKQLNDVEIQVQVLGDNDQGFSYKIIKQ